MPPIGRVAEREVERDGTEDDEGDVRQRNTSLARACAA
jgi:hypothetical protein